MIKIFKENFGEILVTKQTFENIFKEQGFEEVKEKSKEKVEVEEKSTSTKNKKNEIIVNSKELNKNPENQIEENFGLKK